MINERQRRTALEWSELRLGTEMAQKERIKIEKIAFEFAKKVVGLVIAMPRNEIRFTLGKQLLRSGTSIGANVEEAQGGLTKKDFVHSINIAKKEARESLYWIRLLGEFDFIPSTELTGLQEECSNILNILTAIVKTSQQR